MAPPGPYVDQPPEDEAYDACCACPRKGQRTLFGEGIPLEPAVTRHFFLVWPWASQELVYACAECGHERCEDCVIEE